MSPAVHSDCSRLNAGTRSATGTVRGTKYSIAVLHWWFEICIVQATLQSTAVLQSALQCALFKVYY